MVMYGPITTTVPPTNWSSHIFYYGLLLPISIIYQSASMSVCLIPSTLFNPSSHNRFDRGGTTAMHCAQSIPLISLLLLFLYIGPLKIEANDQCNWIDHGRKHLQCCIESSQTLYDYMSREQGCCRLRLKKKTRVRWMKVDALISASVAC